MMEILSYYVWGSFEEKAINLWLLFNSLHEPNSNLQVAF